MRRHIPVVQVDNRDSRTTWLWTSDWEYVEVDPVELIENMIENCAHVITDPQCQTDTGQEPVSADELKLALSILQRV